MLVKRELMQKIGFDEKLVGMMLLCSKASSMGLSRDNFRGFGSS